MARRKARAEHRRYEHRLRSRVREHRGCLDALSGTTRRLLGLRAGLEGRPLSRGDAASRLGISSRRAASLERTGLRTLEVACGGSITTASPRVARLATSAPALQPASFLVPAASAPELRPAADLTKPRGRHAVESASVTSPAPSGAGAGAGPVSAAAALEPGGSGPGLALILAICLATLAVLILVALRRSVAGRQEPQPAAAAAPAPPAEPVATYVPPQRQPPAEQEQPARPASRATRAATVAATTAVSVIVRELLRRRGSRR